MSITFDNPAPSSIIVSGRFSGLYFISDCYLELPDSSKIHADTISTIPDSPNTPNGAWTATFLARTFVALSKLNQAKPTAVGATSQDGSTTAPPVTDPTPISTLNTPSVPFTQLARRSPISGSPTKITIGYPGPGDWVPASNASGTCELNTHSCSQCYFVSYSDSTHHHYDAGMRSGGTSWTASGFPTLPRQLGSITAIGDDGAVFVQGNVTPT
jgi:hypothetical protein